MIDNIFPLTKEDLLPTIKKIDGGIFSKEDEEDVDYELWCVSCTDKEFSSLLSFNADTVMFLDDERAIVSMSQSFFGIKNEDGTFDAGIGDSIKDLKKAQKHCTSELVNNVLDREIGVLEISLYDRTGNPACVYKITSPTFHGIRTPALVFSGQYDKDKIFLYFSWDKENVEVKKTLEEDSI